MTLTIRGKLVLMLMATSASAALIAGAGFMTFSALTRFRSSVQNLSGLAEITGRNCEAALRFNIPQDAEAMLGALRAKPTIVSARVYDAALGAFAAYRRDLTRPLLPAPAAIPPKGYVVEEGTLRVFHRIVQQGETLGYVCIQDDLGEIRGAVARNAGVMGGVIVASLLCAFLIAAKVQGVVSRPVRALTDAARGVSHRKDFSVRVNVTGRDELSLLAAAFNQMLANIQARDAALKDEVQERRRAEEELRRHRDTLEDVVAERTAELERTNLRLRMEIVDHERSERKLAATLADLERSNLELEKFAHVASHDLQEPLRKMLSFADRLESVFGKEGNPQAHEYIGRMLNAARLMHELINDLLAFSRLANRPARLSRFPLRAVMDEVAAELEGIVQSTGARLVVGDLPEVVADRAQIREMLYHLVENAIKFRRPDVTPEIHVTTRLSGPGAPGAAGWLELDVADNGIGFDEKYTDRIFQIFQRLHPRGQYDGTGIGLAICRRIAIRHGGTITARSKAGQGSVFTVRIPDSGKTPVAGGAP